MLAYHIRDYLQELVKETAGKLPAYSSFVVGIEAAASMVHLWRRNFKKDILTHSKYDRIPGGEPFYVFEKEPEYRFGIPQNAKPQEVEAFLQSVVTRRALVAGQTNFSRTIVNDRIEHQVSLIRTAAVDVDNNRSWGVTRMYQSSVLDSATAQRRDAHLHLIYGIRELALNMLYIGEELSSLEP